MPDGEMGLIGTPTATMRKRSAEFAKGGTPNPAEYAEREMFATPNTLDSLPPKSPEALHREATITRPGRSKPSNLRDQVSNAQMWPTPHACCHTGAGEHGTGGMNLQTAVKMLPTPTQRDYKGSTEARRDENHPRHNDSLDSAVETNQGRLNPRFVEWMMHWPLGWCKVGGKLSQTSGE